MTAAKISTKGSGTFSRGVHPPQRKNFAQDAKIEILPTPKQVVIPLLQHIGAPCKLAVEPRVDVKLGDILGDAGGFVSAPVHSSINGKTAKTVMRTLPSGARVPCVPINADGEQLEGQALWDDIYGGEWPVTGLEKYKREDIQKAVSDAGIVGMGGAAFPTHVKFAKNDKKPIDTLIVNGCECEPYLTSDYRLMLEASAPIITGTILAAQAVGASNIAIGVEDNKPKAIEILKKAAEGTPVKIVPLKTKYPQGGERSLVPAVVNRTIPTLGLPLDVGVVVINVGTATAVARAVLRGKPFTHRIMTVTGAGVRNPKNLLVPIGVSYSEVLEFCGGFKPDAARAVSGGPMMGFTMGDMNTPVTKGTSGFTILTHEDIKKADETTCIRCGRCVDACPLDLVPTRIALASKFKQWDIAKAYSLQACVECGCCSYVCPSSVPLVQLIRVGKALLPKE